MKIAGSSLQLESSHSQWQRHEVSESLRMWVGARPPASVDDTPGASAARVRLSDGGRSAQAAERAASDASLEATETDPLLSLIRLLVAQLTGEEVEMCDMRPPASAGTAAPLPNLGFGVEYDRHESYTEIEQTSFAASGMVQTADGKTINFNLSLSMARSYHAESSVSLRLGDARKTNDPLAINFSGTAAQLADQRFAFDLNADGTASEQINFLAGGSGFLSFDRNGDGVINDGSELFGAKTGDGFAELAALDADNNGWIDENDAAYAQLSVWTRDSAGVDILRSLQEADVGAISLARVATPFSIKDGSNALQGQVRSSGAYLRESGGVGSVQQVDLTV